MILDALQVVEGCGLLMAYGKQFFLIACFV